MDQSVVIKGFNKGIIVVLDPTKDYGTLKEQLAVKFRESAKFLGNASMALKFEGMKLDDEQQREMIDIITTESKVNVACILGDDPEKEAGFTAAFAEMSAQTPQANLVPSGFNGTFYKGNLRSGMEEIFEGNALIIGDINPGASVTAKGSIIVLGSLKGTAFAGSEGNENAFVLALDMAPVQIRIAETIARSPDHPAKSELKEPQIAFLEDGAIYIEPVTKKVLSERTI